MATDSEFQELYSRLRAGFLSRHFSIGRYFRTNHFCEKNRLLTRRPAADILSLGAEEQSLDRWDRCRDSDNPLLWGSMLLSCLAVEDALGHPQAPRILHAALATLKSLYKFSGDHFDGYPIRWDPTTSDEWQANDAELISKEFLIDSSGNYTFCNSAGDPRHMPLRGRETLVNLIGAEEADRYIKSNGSLGVWRSEYFYRHRRWELSMDELVGLVTSYFMIHKLAGSSGSRGEIVRQVNRLGDYLAEHAYLLVRPVGGLNARGATGILPALEFPMMRAMLAITGNDFSSRTNFEGAMRKAGYWNCLSDWLAWWTLAGVVGGPLIAPLLTGVVASLGIAAFVPGAFPLAGIALPAAGIPAALLSAVIPVASVAMARAYAIYQSRGCFDVSNDSAAQEVAAAFLLMENVPPSLRFEGWMFGSGFTGGKSGSWAAGFPPFIALTALDDPNTTVRDAYFGWLAERHRHLELEPVDRPIAEGCFASAVAVLLGAGPAEEARLKVLLDASHARLTGSTFGGDLPLEDIHLDGNSLGNPQDHTDELTQPAIDYQIGLALAWLHGKRRRDAGVPVTTPGFPNLPTNTYRWRQPLVPIAVMRQAQDGKLVLPIPAIQDQATPRIDLDGADLFDTSRPPLKSPIPAPVLPPPPVTLIYDRVIRVEPNSRDFYAGIDLMYGDEYELSTTGTVSANPFSQNGPNGWDGIEWNTDAALHGALDPKNAHPFCLLGRLGGYFFVGVHRPRERFFYHRPCPLFLRVNGPGTGFFDVRVRVWSARPGGAPLDLSFLATLLLSEPASPGADTIGVAFLTPLLLSPLD